MKKKLIMLVTVATALVALISCENEGPLEPRHDTLPQISEDILGMPYKKALRILQQNGFIESDEAHAPRYSWHLSTYSLDSYRRYGYDEVKYFVRGEKETLEREYNYDEWITIGMRNDTLYAFRSILFPNDISQAVNKFREWSNFAYNTACTNPYFWSAYLYYGSKDPRSVSFTVDSTYLMYVDGSRTEYEEALTQIEEEDIIEIGDYYLRYNKPKAVGVRYARYDGMLRIYYDAEYTARPFWGPEFDGGDGPGSSTVEPTDPNQNPAQLWHPNHQWKDIKLKEYRLIR